MFESLELRRMLANYTWTDAAHTLAISLGNNESLTVAETSGSVSFTLSAGTFTQVGGDTASGSGSATITLAAADLASSVTINNSTVTTGTNNVTFSGSGSLSSVAISVNITDADATGTISTTGGFDLTSTGAGGITLETNRNIDIAASTAISTASGNITLRANRQATATAGGFVGIRMIDATLSTSGTGNILLEGRGGNTSLGFDDGIKLIGQAKVQSTLLASNAGTITIDGTGGSQNTNFADFGVNLFDTNTLITSAYGDIQITGRVGDGTGGQNVGVVLFGTVSSTGDGSDAATIHVNGTGGNGTAGFDYGVQIAFTGHVTSKDGDIEIVAAPGADTLSALRTSNTGNIQSTGLADITLIADGMGINGSNAIQAGANTVTLKTKTTGGAIGIDIGGDDSSMWLGLTDAELDRISAGRIIIGDASNPTTIKVTAAIQHAGDANFELLSGRSIRFEDGSSWTTTNGDLSCIANQGTPPTGGLYFESVRVEGTITTNGTGDILLQGHGGDRFALNMGVSIYGTVQSTSTAVGAGTITFIGQGGLGATEVLNPGVRVSGGTVTSVSGDIQITGTGGGRDQFSTNNYGVLIDQSGIVSSTGAAQIFIDGTGGTGSSGNSGVVLDTNGKISSKDGDIQITATAGQSTVAAFVQFNSAVIESTGTADVTIISDADAINDTTAINAGTNTVTLKTRTTNGAIRIDIGRDDNSFTLGLTDAELDRITAGTIVIGDADTQNVVSVVAAIQHAGDANFEVLSGREIGINAPNGSWTSVAGDLTFRANQGATPSPGNFIGVTVNGGRITSTSGDITLEGRGGNGGSLPGNKQYGVIVQNGGLVGQTSGKVTLTGTGGGASNGSENYGVYLVDAGTEVSAGGSAGTVKIVGQGGNGSGGSNRGVVVANGAKITSGGGDVTVDGTGGGSGAGANDAGVFVSGGTITAGGFGVVNVTGQGGNAAGTGNGNFGVYVNGANSFITSTTGPVKVVGIGTPTSEGIRLAQGGEISSGGADGGVTLETDSLAIDATSTVRAGAAGDQGMIIRTHTPGALIALGGSDALTVFPILGLTDAELDRVFASFLTIGSDDSGHIECVAEITRSTNTTVELRSGQFIIFYNSGRIDTAGGDLQIHPGANQYFRPNTAGVDATANRVIFSDPSQLQIGLGGAIVDTGYEQLNVVGKVDLLGLSLSVIADAIPQPGDVYTIVKATSVVDEFDGLPDGSKINVAGVDLTIHYTSTTVTLSAGRTAADIIVLGAEAGASPRVKVIDALSREVIVSFLAYSSSFRGGVRVAVADMNGDGQAEVIVAPGAGMSSQVRVFDLEGHELTDFRTTAYAGFSGGVFVAAGDVNGDGRVDLITTPGAGLSSQVKVFKNRVGIPSTNPDPLSNSPIYTFNAFGSTFKGGATVAAGDVTGDGRADIVVGNGPGMSPHVRVFDTSLIDPPPPVGKITLGPFLYQITPFNSTDRGGVFVAVGDVRGDSRAEIIIGNGLNGRSRVEMYNPDGSRFKSFTAYNAGEGKNAPVHVATKNVDLETFDEILTGQGTPGSVGQLRSFKSDGTLNDSIFEGEDDFRFGFFVA